MARIQHASSRDRIHGILFERIACSTISTAHMSESLSPTVVWLLLCRNRHLLLHNLLGLISLLLHQNRELQQRSSGDEVLRAWSALAILARDTAELEVVASRVILVALLLFPLLVPDLWVAVQVAVPIAALDQLNLSRSLCKNLSLLSELTLKTYGIPRLLHQLRGQHVGIALAAPAFPNTTLSTRLHVGVQGSFSKATSTNEAVARGK